MTRCLTSPFLSPYTILLQLLLLAGVHPPDGLLLAAGEASRISGRSGEVDPEQLDCGGGDRRHDRGDSRLIEADRSRVLLWGDVGSRGRTAIEYDLWSQIFVCFSSVSYVRRSWYCGKKPRGRSSYIPYLHFFLTT